MKRTTVHRTLVRPAAVLLAAGVLFVAPTAPTHAATEAVPTTCSKLLEHTRIEGDVVVPAGATCDVTRVAITGDVIVDEGAALGLVRSVVKGDVLAHQNSRIGLDRAAVWGGIKVDGALRVTVSNSTVFRSIRGDLAQLNLHDGADVRGAVNVATASRRSTTSHTSLRYTFNVYRATIGGWANLHGGDAYVIDSAFERGLTVSRSGLYMCGSTVAGDLVGRWSHNPIEIGEYFKYCDESTISGSIHLYDNPHPVLVGVFATIEGDLVCTGNTADVQHRAATVRGTRVGQCS